MAKSLEESIAELNVSVVALTAALNSGKATTAPKATTTKADKAAAAVKAPTVAAVKKAAEDFLAVAGDDETEYNNRRAHIKDIVAKYKAPKLTEVAEDERQGALDMLAAYVAPEAPAGDDDI